MRTKEEIEDAKDAVYADIPPEVASGYQHEENNSFLDDDIFECIKKAKKAGYTIIGVSTSYDFATKNDKCPTVAVLEDKNGNRYWVHTGRWQVHDWIQKTRAAEFDLLNGPFQVGIGSGIRVTSKDGHSVCYNGIKLVKDGLIETFDAKSGKYTLTDNIKKAISYDTLDELYDKAIDPLRPFVPEGKEIYCVCRNEKWD
jgi:hypothetical protein